MNLSDQRDFRTVNLYFLKNLLEMDSNFLLVEHLSNVNAIIKQPLQLTQRIKFTCFDVSKTYIVFGATSGGLYVFNRHPHEFIKLIPSKEGSVVQVCISPDERHIGLSTSKGIVMIIQNCFMESNFHYETYSEHRDNLVTAMKWYMDELFCGDNTGKITVVVLPSLLAKAIFQVTCATLMQLESSVVQIDVYLKFLLISTLTKTYICDTDKEQYRQIGKKLRNGHFGACFAVNNVDPNIVPPEILTHKGVYKKLKDDEHFLTHINDNIQIFCSRPGTRMWEAKLNASVTRTHQLKNFLKDKPTDIIKLDDNCDVRLNICTNNDLKVGDLINFSKVFTFENKFVITFSRGGFYIFDPKAVMIICYCNYFKNIKDLKIIDNFIYIWDDDLEVHVVAFYSLEKIILKTLFNKQYYVCADLCVHYITHVLNLIESSKNIHLISILKEKLLVQSDDSYIEKLSPIFEAIKDFTNKTYPHKLKTGIVVVNPYINCLENKYEKEPLPETFQMLKGISSNVTEKLTESTRNLKEKFHILETTVKNLTLKDNFDVNGVDHAETTNTNTNDSDKYIENGSTDVQFDDNDPKIALKIFLQQYQLSKINRNLKTPKFYHLLDKYDLNKTVELFTNFSNPSNKVDHDVKLWCYHNYLIYLSKVDFESIVQTLKPEDAAINYAVQAFCFLNASQCKCACSYPLPSAKENNPEYYDIGCILMKKLWSSNRLLSDEVVNEVPYMWKYILKDLRFSESIGTLLPLLMQFGDEDLIGVFASKFKYDEWDDAIQLLIKLRKHTCIHCDNKFDTSCNVMSWTNFGTIMIQRVGPQSTINLLMRYSDIIPSNELDTNFYQRCIFTAVVDNSYNGIRTKAIIFAKTVQDNEDTTLEFDDIMKKFLQRKRCLKHKRKNGFCSTVKTEYKCSFCDLPVDIPLLNDAVRLSCNHLYHSICLKYNNNVCEKCP
ncbi:hypothetical protein RN001_003068 [Aquatica leii]|uniref:RING-type domain-containing protein n=1 Tax=Aquatica leii TaxID=1421715 RepID=A0AAN7PHS3_9COLE|nr:hypothetical protein RN001_003068 [Aquatica leii]